MAKILAMTTNRRNVPLIQEIGIAEFNGGDAISTALLFLSVQSENKKLKKLVSNCQCWATTRLGITPHLLVVFVYDDGNSKIKSRSVGVGRMLHSVCLFICRPSKCRLWRSFPVLKKTVISHGVKFKHIAQRSLSLYNKLLTAL